MTGNLDCALMLVEYRCDLNCCGGTIHSRTPNGGGGGGGVFTSSSGRCTPMHLAALRGHVRLVKLLMMTKASPYIQCELGAVMGLSGGDDNDDDDGGGGSGRVSQSKGKDDEGWWLRAARLTPLGVACLRGHSRCVELLMPAFKDERRREAAEWELIRSVASQADKPDRAERSTGPRPSDRPRPSVSPLAAKLALELSLLPADRPQRSLASSLPNARLLPAPVGIAARPPPPPPPPAGEPAAAAAAPTAPLSARDSRRDSARQALTLGRQALNSFRARTSSSAALPPTAAPPALPLPPRLPPPAVDLQAGQQPPDSGGAAGGTAARSAADKAEAEGRDPHTRPQQLAEAPAALTARTERSLLQRVADLRATRTLPSSRKLPPPETRSLPPPAPEAPEPGVAHAPCQAPSAEEIAEARAATFQQL